MAKNYSLREVAGAFKHSDDKDEQSDIQKTIWDLLMNILRSFKIIKGAKWRVSCRKLLGMTGPPNSFIAQGPITLTAILFPQPAM